MTTTTARCAFAFVSSLACAWVTACHPGASEPAAASTPAEAGAVKSAAPRQTRRIVSTDHRHMIPLHVDDRLTLPDDPAFDWRIDFEDKGAFTTVHDGDAGEAYRVVKTGPLRIMVYGDPKCLKNDGGCGLSKRRWDITVDSR